MAHTSRRLKAIAVLCAGALLAGNAHAVLGAFFYAKVKTDSEIVAGLDEKTRDLIDGMPEKVRVEAIKALKEAKPMVDESVAKYLEDLDARLSNRIDQTMCSLAAAGEIVLEKLKGPWGEKTPMSTLKSDYDKRKHFDPKNVRNLSYTYVDLVKAIAIVGCGVFDMRARAIVQELREEVTGKMNTWHQIRDLCSTPAECLEMRYPYVRQLIANSDPRDVEFTKAKAEYEKVNGKPVSKVGTGFFGDRTLKWTIDESELVKLYFIERSIDAAQSLRSENAKLYMRDASLVLTKAEDALALAKPKVSVTSSADNDTAIKYADEALSFHKEVTDNANAAISAHDSQKADGARVLARIAQIHAEANGIKESAQRNKVALARKPPAPVPHPVVECKGKNGCVSLDSPR